MEAKGNNLAVKRPLFAVVFATVKTVLAGAIGIRRCSDAVSAESLSPIHIIIAAIIFVALFIGTLLTIVHIVLKNVG